MESEKILGRTVRSLEWISKDASLSSLAISKQPYLQIDQQVKENMMLTILEVSRPK
ncbi:MAG: hypothetical protein ACSI46_17740 [Gloeotrichia echinulata DVL01]|jgi:hypothetical protein